MSCLGCGEPETLVCEQCLRNALTPKVKRFYQGRLRAIYGGFDYHDKLTRELIAQFKYHGVTELAEVFGRVLSVLVSGKISGSAILVPIPADFWRRLERGYNQTELLSAALERQSGWPVLAALKKLTPTPSQTDLDRKQRRKNIKGKFFWRGGSLRGKTVVIVDDVTTTGATLQEAARAIGRAKPASVVGLVVAFD